MKKKDSMLRITEIKTAVEKALLLGSNGDFS